MVCSICACEEISVYISLNFINNNNNNNKKIIIITTIKITIKIIIRIM